MTNYTANKERYFFGTRKEDGERIYITMPTWDCGSNWSFGYLGNRNEHYHLSGYQHQQRVFNDKDKGFVVLTEKRNINMHDALLADYDLADNIKDNLWLFCELALSVYTLKEAAEVLGRGGSHMTKNPCENVIKQPEAVRIINEQSLPTVFKDLEVLISTGNVEA